MFDVGVLIYDRANAVQRWDGTKAVRHEGKST
jgi:hypothetical protein